LAGSEDRYIINITSNDGYLTDPNEIEARLVPENSDVPVAWYDTFDGENIRLLSTGKYEITIPPLPKNDYVLVIRYRFDESQRYETRIIKIKVVTTMYFSILPEIRLLIDKAQKSVNKIQGYSDASILMAMDMSVDFFNEYPPVTHFCAEALMGNWRMLFIYGAVIWALKSQLVLEIDLSFDYSGQTISLQYDHKGDISSYIQQLLEEYRGFMDKVKTHIALDAASIGTVGKRIYPSANTLIYGDSAIDNGLAGSGGGGRGSSTGSSRGSCGGQTSSSRSSAQNRNYINTNDVWMWGKMFQRSKPYGPQNECNPIGSPKMFPPIRY
jgi:hypothetical protein